MFVPETFQRSVLQKQIWKKKVKLYLDYFIGFLIMKKYFRTLDYFLTSQKSEVQWAEICVKKSEIDLFA